MPTEVLTQFVFNSRRTNPLQLAQVLASVSGFGEAKFHTKRSFSQEAVNRSQVEVYHPDTVRAYQTDPDFLLSPDIVVWRIGRFDPFQPKLLVPTNKYQVTVGSKNTLGQEELVRKTQEAIGISLDEKVARVLNYICTPYKEMDSDVAARIHLSHTPRWFPLF